MHVWVRSPEGAKVARYEASLTSKPTATARHNVNGYCRSLRVEIPSLFC
jgi:hypothetical protein